MDVNYKRLVAAGLALVTIATYLSYRGRDRPSRPSAPLGEYPHKRTSSLGGRSVPIETPRFSGSTPDSMDPLFDPEEMDVEMGDALDDFIDSIIDQMGEETFHSLDALDAYEAEMDEGGDGQDGPGDRQ